MAQKTYDIITVGGGLGGSALAKAMAEHGARVLVLEREEQFKDRVRGEFMATWGVAEARKLGIDQLLRDSCAQDLPYQQLQIGSIRAERRDLRTTTPQGVAVLSVYHPAMQKLLLQAAADAGAEVRRGVIARDVKKDGLPTVLIEQNGHSEEVQARLVVGADGRSSMVRKGAGFTVHQDPERLLITGVLLENLPIPQADTFCRVGGGGALPPCLRPLGQTARTVFP
jgi:2-polyprenyl-6-methoxyphenol hydroxylase-like FAD-dependent oxidoreductase